MIEATDLCVFYRVAAQHREVVRERLSSVGDEARYRDRGYCDQNACGKNANREQLSRPFGRLTDQALSCAARRGLC